MIDVNVGAITCIASELVVDRTDDGMFDAMDRVFACYIENSKPGKHLGKMVECVGMEPFKMAIA